MHCIKRNISRSANILLSQPPSIGEDDHLRLWGNTTNRLYWQHSFHDHVIRDDIDLARHIEYIRFNPRKHGVAKQDEPYPFLWIMNNLYG
jgi:REP element-mobilizing transposase RayT